MRSWLTGVMMAVAGCAAPIGPLLAQDSGAAKGGATASPPIPPASTSGGPAVHAGKAPSDPNTPASLYVYIGRTFWPGGAQGGIGKGRRWEVSVDGGGWVPVGADTFVEFDTSAGKHVVSLHGEGVSSKPVPTVDLNVAPGEEVYLAINRYQALSPEMRAGLTTFVVAGGGVLPYLAGAAIAHASAPLDRVKIAGPLDHPHGVWLVREAASVEGMGRAPR